MTPGGWRAPQQGAAPTEDVSRVAQAMDLLALTLTTGVPTVHAIEAVAAVSGPVVAHHLRQVAAALRWGLSCAQAWEVVPEVWRPARQALALAETTGAAPGSLLRDAARSLRRAEAVHSERAAARLGVWLVVPLGLCFLPAFFLIAIVPTVVALSAEVLPR